MKNNLLRNSLLLGGFIAFLVVSVVSWCDQTTVYIVRHAERAPGVNDPPLSPEGETRAIALKDLLLNKNIGFIYSTDSLRTKSTAQPLADALGLKTTIYQKGTSPVTESGLPLHHTGNILVVGHSETILDIFTSVGATPDLTSIAGNDFDNLLIATVYNYFFLKWITCEETTYGAVSP